MEPVHHEGSEYSAVNAAVAPGAAAFSALKQLIKELEPVLGAEAVERVRAAAEKTITASALPLDVEAAFLHGLR